MALGACGCLASCEPRSQAPYQPAPIPPLESVPFAAVGSGKIVFNRVGGGYLGGFYVIDAGAGTFKYAGGPGFQGPAASPDGSKMAFTGYAPDPGWWGVWVSNLGDTAARQLTRFRMQVGPPAWTPDGKKIVFAADSGSGILWFNFYSQSPDPGAGDLRQITRFPVPFDVIVCPYVEGRERASVSPWGDLAFVCGTSVYVTDSVGGGVASIYTAELLTQLASPTWSPDGQKIAFLEVPPSAVPQPRTISVTLRLMNADGTGVWSLATVSGKPSYLATLNPLSLCWTPDGSTIVFSGPDGDLGYHLWLVRSEGTGLTRLTSAPGITNGLEIVDHSVSCTR